MREYCKELAGASEKLGAEVGDYPEDTFSGDPGNFPNPRNPSKGNHTGAVSLPVTVIMPALDQQPPEK